MSSSEILSAKIEARCAGLVTPQVSTCGEVTFEVSASNLLSVCTTLRDDAELKFEQLVDVTGVDYLQYGRVEWNTQESTSSGFSRGVNRQQLEVSPDRRFAVVYHLLSVTNNNRVRLRCFCEPGEPPLIDSVCDVWASANWFEREVFDMFGVEFTDHPDLTRILMPEDWIGHPLRKDFDVGRIPVQFKEANA